MNDSAVIGILRYGDRVKIVEERNGYGKLDTTLGWVSTNYLAQDKFINGHPCYFVTAPMLNIRENSCGRISETKKIIKETFKCSFCLTKTESPVGCCEQCGAPI